MSHPAADRTPGDRPAALPAPVDVSLLTSGHHVADARLHRHCAALRRAGLSVEVLARGRAADAPPGVDFRPIESGGLARRGLHALLLPTRARGRVLLTLDPDLVPAARLHRALCRPLPGARRLLVVDVHEDYQALLRDRVWAHGAVGAAARVWARAATLLSRRADLTVVADEHVPPRSAANRLVVRNLPDFRLLPAPQPPGPVPRALYVGDIRGSRGLWTMLAAAEAAPDWQLDLVGPVALADRDRLRDWQRTSPAAHRVRLHGRMPPRAAWRLAQGAWAGLALLEPTRAFVDSVPSKVYEYLACGLPVLGSPLPRAEELVRSRGAGTVADGPEQAARILTGWAGPQRDAYDRCRAGAVRWSDEHRQQESPYDGLAVAVAELLAAARLHPLPHPAEAA
ncbi:glycosyltransferase family protein [Peterkaempfera bronchialis]|uniref:D-inositol 3-phosphate glycosyltransferase n=1 Tax=Peterkaempfera bronchialis TaxID=2126346 RepID=A0A345T144_9ACTN|nr:glycosyltransferase [Peterkaempfera bronchialis]AXI79699.1 glycosyltransferase [Peterkaempfera bronchialis]